MQPRTLTDGTLPHRPPEIEPVPGGPDIGPSPDGTDSAWAGAPAWAQYRSIPYVPLIETDFLSGTFEPIAYARAETVSRGMDGRDTTATISIALDSESIAAAGQLGERHFTHWLERIKPDRRVIIRQQSGSQHVLFDGYPLTSTFRWSRGGQVLTFTCKSRGECYLEDDLACQMIGRWMRKAPHTLFDDSDSDLTLVAATPLHFNAGGKPNRAAEHVEIGGYKVYPFTFDADPTAKHWTVSQALSYLVYFGIPAGGAVSTTAFWADLVDLFGDEYNPEMTDSFRKRMARRIDEERMDCLDVRRCLLLVCDGAGLHLETALEMLLPGPPKGEGSILGGGTDETGGGDWQHYLRVFTDGPATEGGQPDTGEHMGQPRLMDLPREAPRTEVGERAAKAVAAANVAENASFTYDTRAVSKPIYYGGTKFYEVTLYLLPGWLPWKPPYDGYDLVNLVDPPSYRSLDDVDSDDDDAVKAAIGWWKTLLYQDTDEQNHVTHQMHWSNPLHKYVADVGRLWIFPTDTRRAPQPGEEQSRWAREWVFGYDGEYDPIWPGGEGLEPGDNVLGHYEFGAGIAAAANWVARARRMHDMISQFKETGDRAPVLHFNFERGDPEAWFKVTEQRTFLPGECALRLDIANPMQITPPNVPAKTDNLIYAIIENRVLVRITCVIEGDDRLELTKDSTTLTNRLVRKVHDVGERFRWRSRSAGNSTFYVPGEEEPNPEYDSVDDGERLEEYADLQAEIEARETVAGNPQVFWIEPALKLGDVLTGIAGLGIDFPRPAVIAGISYDIQSRKTQLTLGDFRDDVDLEVGDLEVVIADFGLTIADCGLRIGPFAIRHSAFAIRTGGAPCLSVLLLPYRLVRTLDAGDTVNVYWNGGSGAVDYDNPLNRKPLPVFRNALRARASEPIRGAWAQSTARRPATG